MNLRMAISEIQARRAIVVQAGKSMICAEVALSGAICTAQAASLMLSGCSSIMTHV